MGKETSELLIKALNDYLTSSNISQNALSKAIGVSASALSQYMKKKYPGDVSVLESKISQYLNISQEREEYPKAQIGFVVTSIVQQVTEIARNCHIGQKIGIVTGDSGLGKTTSVKHYVENNPDVIIVYGRPSITTKSLIRELAYKVNVDPQGSIDDVFMRIVYRLKGSGRMLIVDEAEHLTARVLDQLRRLNDPEFAGIGILLVGLPRLLSILRSSQGDHKYLYSRVGWNIAVNTLSETDCESFVERVLPDCPKKLWKVFASYANYNARALCNLLERSVEVAAFNDAEIDADLIKETARLLIA